MARNSNKFDAQAIEAALVDLGFVWRQTVEEPGVLYKRHVHMKTGIIAVVDHAEGKVGLMVGQVQLVAPVSLMCDVEVFTQMFEAYRSDIAKKSK